MAIKYHTYYGNDYDYDYSYGTSTCGTAFVNWSTYGTLSMPSDTKSFEDMSSYEDRISRDQSREEPDNNGLLINEIFKKKVINCD